MNRERRKSNRIEYPGYVVATVRIGRKRLPCQLADESAGGMRLIIGEPVEIEAGQRLMVSTPSGTWAIRVIRVEYDRENTIVGCDRGDGVLPSEGQASAWEFALRPAKTRILMTIGLVLICLAVGGGMIWGPGSAVLPQLMQLRQQLLDRTPTFCSPADPLQSLRSRVAALGDKLSPAQQFQAAMVLERAARAIASSEISESDSEIIALASEYLETIINDPRNGKPIPDGS